VRTEDAVRDRFDGVSFDYRALETISHLFRTTSAIRNHFEREVLADHRLTWTGWVVLWVIWTWTDIECRDAASEAGISKSTLTGVVATLSSQGLVYRGRHPQDRRRVVLSLSESGHRLMTRLFPELNQRETEALSILSAEERDQLSRTLSRLIDTLEPGSEPTTLDLRIEQHTSA